MVSLGEQILPIQLSLPSSLSKSNQILFFHGESALGASKAHKLHVRLPGWQAATVPLLISVPAHETHLTQNLFQLLQLFLACVEIS